MWTGELHILNQTAYTRNGSLFIVVLKDTLVE